MTLMTDGENTRPEFHLPLISKSSRYAGFLCKAPVFETLLRRLADLSFPYQFDLYPGRWAALGRALGYARYTLISAAAPKRQFRLSRGMALRAAEFCEAQAKAYEVLGRQFRDHAAKSRGRSGPWRGGFHVVRVRDDTGIPRNARWTGGKRKPVSEGELPIEPEGKK